MPKENILYCNTIIYKIVCNDENVKDIYVGYTTNFSQRKCKHKQECNNMNNKLLIYNAIRTNGGWSNWSMFLIATYNCKNAIEAKIKEQYHYDILTKTQTNNITKKYETINEEGIEKFICDICNFSSHKKSNYEMHLKTDKHAINMSLHSSGNAVEITKMPDDKNVCDCGKKYNTHSGLWKHIKKCVVKGKQQINKIQQMEEEPIVPFKITTEMFYDLLKQNNELHKSLIEMSREKGTYINNCNNNNSNNKTFNLQVYLNETCKDAINLTEFIDKIQVTIADLEKIGETGYAEGISKVFIKNLNNINVDERPLHCTDSKRETLYIKDNDQWTKDDEDKSALTKAIKQVTNKNINQIFEWQKLYPEYTDPESKQSDKYLKIVMNSMPGSTTEETNRNYEKVIKNIIKKTVIEKTIIQP